MVNYFRLLNYPSIALIAHLMMGFSCAGQLADTSITWQDYSRVGTARIQVFRSAAAEKKGLVVVIDELADNMASPAIADARYLVEKIGRELATDPSEIYWIFRWSGMSFASDATSSKSLLLQATIGRSKQGNLTGPSWKVITTHRLKELTDRVWQR